MLDFLQSAHKEKNLKGQGLLTYWHQIMESVEGRADRANFFEGVIKQAIDVSHLSSSLFPAFVISFDS